MRITVDGAIYNLQARGGISRLFNEILPRMCSQDPEFEVTLVTEPHLLQEPPRHPRIHRATLWPTPRPRRVWRRLTGPANRWRSRAVSSRSALWHSSYYTLSPSRSLPSVVTVYDMIYERLAKSEPFPDSARIIARKRRAILGADRLICISQAALDEVAHFHGIERAKCRVVPLSHSDCFRPLPHEAPRPALIPAKPYILYVGSRTFYKQFATLARALARAECRDLMLVVAGAQWSNEEVGELRRLGIESRVVLRQGVSDENLRLLYACAAAFVYPSLFEGFGIPVLEAMACGCPVVASRIPSTEEIAGDAPFYFVPGSADDLARALDEALTQGRDGWAARRGLECARRYSWERTASDTLAVYREMI